ncbi:MAG: carboxypeptidase regulatory-like domain-containing protein [Bacteroidia bacterium]|nr:carboxypeptidase regulatory-like domain-containing protein [Bacteroidia bacterium]
MNRRRVSSQVLLYFFMLMLLIVTVGCSKSDDLVPAGTTYGISGEVTLTGLPLSGVTVTLSGRSTGTYTTGADGKYSFTGLPKGSYTVTPTPAGHTFNPVSKVVIITGSNMKADFVETSFTDATYSISGKVNGVAVSGVKITIRGTSIRAEVLTNGDGTYTSPSLPTSDGPYTVTPYNSGYAFMPPKSNPITLSGANSIGNDFASESSAFTQADLEGTWEVHALETSTASGGWYRFTVTIDPTGTLINCVDSSGGGSCPAGTVVWAINPFTGVITESGTGGNPGHYSMASNKNFIAGTQYYPIGTSTTTSPALLIAQKKVEGTVYSNDDIRSKNFVFHQLNVGSSNKWQYGAGSINGTGTVNININNDPVGTSNPGDTGIISVSNDGVVTMTGTGIAQYHGFLSDNKRTIVGTFTKGGTEFSIMIIQIINGECNCYTSNIAGTSYGHVLATGVDPAPFWVDQTISITGGVMKFDIWLRSNPAVTSPGTKNISISSSKTATIIGSDFNGQLSYDEKFMVGTETFRTNNVNVFAMDIFTY